MHYTKKKFRELFRFFERLSFLISTVLLFTKMYLEKNKTALRKNLFFMKILRYTYCKLIK